MKYPDPELWPVSHLFFFFFFFFLRLLISNTAPSSTESESDSENVKQQKTKHKAKKVRIARALSDISIYCQSRHFPGFTHDGCSPFKIISFSERVSLAMIKQSLQEYINMHKTHLTRVYPAAFRINSNNYDPHHHWAGGAQVVALNYQCYGMSREAP